MLSAGTLLQGLESEEEQPLIWTVAVEAGSTDEGGGGDVVLLLHDRRDLVGHLLRLGEGGAVLQLKDAQSIALILLRDEGRGQGIEGNRREHDATAQTRQDEAALADQEGHQAHIRLLQALEETVELVEDPAEATAGEAEQQHPEHIGADAEGCSTEATEGQPHHHASHGPAPALGPGRLLGFENQAGHHRREREGVEGGDGDRESDRESELAVDNPDAAGVEGHRHEHRHQHQRGGDQGADQLAHALQCRLAWLHALLEVLGHRLDHHNGVVDHQARGQHEAQQGELVDREAEGLDEGKGAHQRDWDRQAGHDGGPPVLQEQEQDHQHQHNRQAEGVGDAIDSRFDELTHVVDLIHRDARRQLAGELVHQRHHRFRNLQRVAVRCLIHADGDRRIAVDIGALRGEAVEAVGRLTDVLQAEQVALGSAPHDQLVELLNRGEIAVVLDQNRIGEQLVATRRWAAHQATNRHGVLAAQSRHHLIGSELVGA